MRAKPGIWLALAVGVFGSLLGVVPMVLRAAHLNWPAWPVALAGAAVTWIAGAAKPVVNSVTEALGDRARRTLDLRDRARQLERTVGGREKGLPTAGEINDRALLGIHPSIPLPPEADSSLAPDLPLYIPRDLDDDLRAWVTAHMASGGFLLLVGPAASGKSRCAYELAHGMLADWPIFMPSNAEQVTDYFGTNPAPGRLVVWLNETQKFLRSDGLTTETMRHILALPWPVIIIGTIWPQSYDALTSAPDNGLGNSTQDAREILTMLGQRKDLLPGFSAAELNRAANLAARDPRIAEALAETASPNLAETLAAAPALISRWLNAADPYGAAVITAAVIARRCGHPEPLPATVLEPLAGKMLTSAQRGRATTHWFPDALSWAQVPVRGEAAPLAPYASAPGIVDGDQVSDVLVQHAIRDQAVPGHFLPEAVWLLLIKHATPRACQHIADVAYEVRHAYSFTITEAAIRKAAEHGDGLAMANLGVLLREQGKIAESEQWLRKAVEAGNMNAMLLLGGLFTEYGKTPEAEHWLLKAAEAGDAEAMVFLGAVFAEQGKTGEAEKWGRRAAGAGHTDAMHFLGSLLKKQGRAAEAEQWYRQAAEAGNADGMLNLGVLLSEGEKTGEAEGWYRKAAEAGNARAMANLGILLRKQDEAEAKQWLRKAAEAGNARAMANLGILLRKQDEAGEAERWFRLAAEAGDSDTMALLGVLLAERDETVEAEQWLRKAAEAGNPPAMAFLGTFLMNRGEPTEADYWINAAAQSGHVEIRAILDVLPKEESPTEKSAGPTSA